uniref:Uncharacterized protein n=1 Tax=Hyaloperonospora arabidopsidis (strain Emoy2) TaxID=559515 RepID=M4B3I8_HYAAE
MLAISVFRLAYNFLCSRFTSYPSSQSYTALSQRKTIDSRSHLVLQKVFKRIYLYVRLQRNQLLLELHAQCALEYTPPKGSYWQRSADVSTRYVSTLDRNGNCHFISKFYR